MINDDEEDKIINTQINEDEKEIIVNPLEEENPISAIITPQEEENIDITIDDNEEEQIVNINVEPEEEAGYISMTLPDALNGKDGYSPIATVSQTTTGATITIKDKNGTTAAVITNGTNGRDGVDGIDGKDGVDGKTPIKGVDYFTTEEIENIEAAIEIKIPTKISQLKNDANYIVDENYIHTDNNYTDEEKEKLANLKNYDDTEIQQKVTTLNDNVENNTTEISNINNTLPKIQEQITINRNSIETKVDKIEGKQLSTNDYTNAEKEKLANIENNANYITKVSELMNDSGYLTTETDPAFTNSAAAAIKSSDISYWNDKSDFSGDYNDLTNKPDIPTVYNGKLTIEENGVTQGTFTANQSKDTILNLWVPTRVSELDNNSGFINNMTIDLKNYYLKTATYSAEEIDSKIATMQGLHVSVVMELPETGDENLLYLVPLDTEKTITDAYKEFLYVNSRWELIGTTGIDLTEYAKKTDLPTKISELTNDVGFIEDENYIHTDNNYTASEKNKLSELTNYDDTEVKKLINTKQNILTAGSNITIANDTISANFVDAVTSVNGQIGDVMLNAESVGALGKSTFIPSKISDLTNDSNFIDNTVDNLVNYYNKSTVYNKTEVNELLSSISSLKIEIVAKLPTEEISTSTIYLVPSEKQETSNLYDEYIYVNNKWELIGSTAVDLSNYYTKDIVDSKLSNKQDSEIGKGLSTNDYTDAEKEKLNNIDLSNVIRTTSSVSDLSDGNEYAKISTIPTKTSQLTNDSGYITDISGKQDKLETQVAYTSQGSDTKVPQITTNTLGQVIEIKEITITQPEVNDKTLTIQKNGSNIATFTANSNKDVTANIEIPTKVSELTNDSGYGTITGIKMNGVSKGTTGEVDLGTIITDISGKQDTIDDLTEIRNGAALGKTALQSFTETDPIYSASVAAAITENDITNWNNKSTFDGNYNNLTNKPTIPTKTSQLTNDSGYITDISSKQDKLTAGDNITITNNTISAKDTTYSAATTTSNGLMSSTDKTKIDGIATGAEVNVQSDWNVTDTTSDAYIKNKPTIPTVNNATLTIQKNGTNVQTFTANQDTNATANITVPTKVSELTNDSGYTTNAGTVTSLALNATSPIAIDDSTAITTSGTRTISHATSGATAGSYGDSSNQTPAYGGTFKVPYVTVNNTGHVTGISEHTVKIPASDNTNTTYSLTQDSSDGHKITLTPSSGTAQTITIPDNNTTYSAGTGISLSGTTFSNSGVRSITSGSTNGTISVNTNGTSAEVAVKGLGSNAYTSTTIPTNNNQLTNGAGYITSSGSITGNAATATYANSLKPCANVGSDTASTSGWYKVASSTMSGYGNTNITYLIKAGYSNGYVGILELEMRSDSSKITCWQCKWLSRMGFSAGDVIIVIDSMTWTMYVKNPSTRYGRVYFVELQHRGIQGLAPNFTVTYYNSSSPESTTPTATVTSSDGAICNYANSAGSATKATQDASGNTITSTYYKASNPSGYTTPEVAIDTDEPTDTGIKLFVDTDEETDTIGIGDSLPIGSILPYGSASIPDNFLLCNGQAVSRTSYSELFAIIGTSYGTGDGSTTFNVPDLRGKIATGLNSSDTSFKTLGTTGGSKTHSHKYGVQFGGYYGDLGFEDSSVVGSLIYDSSGNITVSGCGSNIGANSITLNGGNAQSATSTSMATYRMIGQSQYVSNLSPYVTTNYIIKAKDQVVAYGIDIINGLTSTSSTDALSAYQGKVLNDTKADKSKILYDNSSGSNGTITLSETAANFSYLEVFYAKSQSYFQSVKVPTPNGRTACMITGYAMSDSGIQIQTPIITISGTSITHSNDGLVNLGSDGTNGIYRIAEIFIYRVLGYR